MQGIKIKNKTKIKAREDTAKFNLQKLEKYSVVATINESKQMK